jgi:hypothetical protein
VGPGDGRKRRVQPRALEGIKAVWQHGPFQPVAVVSGAASHQTQASGVGERGRQFTARRRAIGASTMGCLMESSLASAVC